MLETASRRPSRSRNLLERAAASRHGTGWVGGIPTTQCSRFVALALLISAAAPVAAQAGEPPAEDDGLAPWLGDLYQEILENLGGEVQDGIEGLVDALLSNTPSTQQVWDLVRFGEDTLKDPPDPGVPDGLFDASVEARDLPGADGDPLAPLQDATVPVDEVLDQADQATDPLSQPLTDPLQELVHVLSHVDLDQLHLPDLEQASASADAPGAPVIDVVDGQGRAGQEGSDVVAPVSQEPLVGSAKPSSTARPSPLPTGQATNDPAALLVAAVQAPLAWLGNPFAEGALAALGFIVLLAPPLYHRLQRHRLLEHEVRARLQAAIVQRPGAHIEELARAAGVARSTAVYHLKLLARHGLVITLESRKAVHYYPNNGQAQESERPRMAMLASPRTRAVAVGVAAGPGRDRSALAAELGISPSTLSWHLGKLLLQELVTERRLGTAFVSVLDPTPELLRLLPAWHGAGEAPGEPAASTMVVA